VSYEDVFAGHVLPVARFRRRVEGEYGTIAGWGALTQCHQVTNVPAPKVKPDPLG
jgi:hypothetical protein